METWRTGDKEGRGNGGREVVRQMICLPPSPFLFSVLYCSAIASANSRTAHAPFGDETIAAVQKSLSQCLDADCEHVVCQHSVHHVYAEPVDETAEKCQRDGPCAAEDSGVAVWQQLWRAKGDGEGGGE